jgi:hypothetical protein
VPCEDRKLTLRLADGFQFEMSLWHVQGLLHQRSLDEKG